MTTINAVDSNPLNTYADPSGLTGDALLLYCQTQLGTYDTTINSFLTEQKLNVTRKKALSDVENTVKKYVNHFDQSSVDDIRNAFDKAINALPENDPTRAALVDKLKEFNSHATPQFDPTPGHFVRIRDNNTSPTNDDLPLAVPNMKLVVTYSTEELTAFAGDIHSMLDTVNGNAEINMIQLQQVMSQRQTAVQLTTNLLSKLDDTTKSVVTNLGR
jgi:hypothetical protein